MGGRGRITRRIFLAGELLLVTALLAVGCFAIVIQYHGTLQPKRMTLGIDTVDIIGDGTFSIWVDHSGPMEMCYLDDKGAIHTLGNITGYHATFTDLAARFYDGRYLVADLGTNKYRTWNSFSAAPAEARAVWERGRVQGRIVTAAEIIGTLCVSATGVLLLWLLYLYYAWRGPTTPVGGPSSRQASFWDRLSQDKKTDFP